MDIVEIVRDQNRWWANPNRRETRRFSQRREVFDRLLSYLGELHGGRAAVLLGPRQVGKTTLLLQLVDELLDRDWPAANITFFDFSDERLVGQVSPRQIVELAPPGLADTHPRVYLLDEIQNALDWQPWLKSAVDQARRGSQPGVRFVVTGSAATALRRAGAESGQGRWDEIPIEGLTLAEFLRISSPGDPEPTSRIRDPRMYARYLEVGGFPEHLSSLASANEVRHRIRADIADRAIVRDLLHTGLDVERLRRLFVYLICGSGNLWNQGKRAEDLDANRKSLSEWLSALEETRLIMPLPRDLPAGSKASTQLRAQPKIFASDHGLITAFAPAVEPLEAPEVRGRVFEAAVFRHLREVARSSGATWSYSRIDEDLEIDFVVRGPSRSVGIEVTGSTDAKPRKLARAAEAMKRLGIEKKILVHGGLDSGLAGDIALAPLHEFLLAPQRFLGAL
jgi:predicted AAA+ superfamily ATPase